MVRIRGSTVGIIGGSIAGCAAAIALARLGCEINVFERSSGLLQDRGAGVMLPPALKDGLIEAEYLPATFPTCSLTNRLWIVADGSSSGRLLWRQPGAAAATNWGVLWRAIRSRVPDDRYHDGMTVAAIDSSRDQVTATFTNGESRSFDFLLGADGYRSMVRSQLMSSAIPEFAGYVAWRGVYPEERLVARAVIDRGDSEKAWFLVGFDGGHAIVYTVPDFDERIDAGHRRVNWLVYSAPPKELDFTEPTSIPPGAVTPQHYLLLADLLETSFPADFRSLVRASPIHEVSIQPIYDLLVDTYAQNRLLLIGDAGAVCRPHTASGTAKALQDAYALERLGRERDNWDDLRAAYDAERTSAGADLVEIGRRIGRDQVEQTPAWSRLTPEDMPARMNATLEGAQLYFYGSAS